MNFIFSVLLILFVTLKLIGLINWSWLWVISPFLIPLSLSAFFLLIGFIYKLIME